MRVFSFPGAAGPRTFAGFLFAVVTSTVATGATGATLNDLDPKLICPAQGGALSKQLFARALVKLYSIPIDIVDWNDNGVNYDDYAQAVIVPRCLNPQSQHDKDKCFGPPPLKSNPPALTAGANAQLQASLEVSSSLDRAQTNSPVPVSEANPKGGFELKLKNVTLLFRRINASPSNMDTTQPSLLLRAGATPIAAEVFSTDPNYFEISCVTKPAPPGGGNGATPGGGSANAPSAAERLNNFRLRGKAQDLNIGRDTDAFSGASAATIATVNDNIAQKNTFDAHVALGYVFPTQQFSAATLTSIPFLEYDRDYVDGAKAPPNSSNVDNFILGIQENLFSPIATDFGANLVVQPQYIWSLRNNAQIAKVFVSLQPVLLAPFFYPTQIGTSDFLASVYVRGALNVGDVVRPTTDPTLALTNNFTQGGLQAGIAIVDQKDGSVFNGISIPVDYTTLYGFTGQYKAISQLSAAVNYTFPKTKYVTVGFSYVDGRNIDTFEKQQIYKVTLGVKY